MLKYTDYEVVLSKPRLERFLVAVNHDSSKAIELYRLNIELSQTLFAILSIFEVMLRNQIDYHYQGQFSDSQWLRTQCNPNGIFSNIAFAKRRYETRNKILETINKLGNSYSHDRLVSDLSLGFWTYMFAPMQFLHFGQTLHRIHINRPKGVNAKLIFSELDEIRKLRNRIAHHEPLCFDGYHQVGTTQTFNTYKFIMKHTDWLGYDQSLYLGLDQTLNIIAQIDGYK